MQTLNDNTRRTTLKDIEALIPTVHGPHAKEIEAHGMSVEEGLKYSFITSKECHTMLEPVTKKVAGIFGISQGYSNVQGCIWAITNDLVFNHKVCLHRNSKHFIKRAHEKYPILANVVWEGNEKHIKWLDNLGFMFLQEITINNNKFYEFARTELCA